jgi:hypothetical protein
MKMEESDKYLIGMLIFFVGCVAGVYLIIGYPIVVIGYPLFGICILGFIVTAINTNLELDKEIKKDVEKRSDEFFQKLSEIIKKNRPELSPEDKEEIMKAMKRIH